MAYQPFSDERLLWKVARVRTATADLSGSPPGPAWL